MSLVWVISVRIMVSYDFLHPKWKWVFAVHFLFRKVLFLGLKMGHKSDLFLIYPPKLKKMKDSENLQNKCSMAYDRFPQIVNFVLTLSWARDEFTEVE